MNDSLAPPFFPGGRMRAGPPPERRILAKRSVAAVLVALLHVLFVIFFTISILQEQGRRKHEQEMLLYLPTLGNDRDSPVRNVAPPLPADQAPSYKPQPENAPRIVIQPEQNPSSSATQGDILGAVGQTLACSAGSWEHLTATEQEFCRHIPWRGAKTPQGNIVMLPDNMVPHLKEAPQEYRASGADQLLHDLHTGGSPCQIMQQTPCLNDVLHPTTDPGIGH